MSNPNSENSEYAHHDPEIIHVDVDLLEVDEVNERKQGVGPRTGLGDLEKSIQENGLQNYPQARPCEDGEGYRIFAGQRRLLAAKSVGLKEIPIIVKDLDDTEALAASINENNEHLRKEVSRKDRARAVEQIVKEWGEDRAAAEFGVEPQTIRNWLEPTRDYWEGTIIDPGIDTEIDTEDLADDLISTIRRNINSPDLAERIIKLIINNNIPPSIIRSAAEVAENETEFVSEMKEQWEATAEGKSQIRPRITLVGDDVEHLRDWAKSRGLNEKMAVKQIVVERLNQENDESMNVKLPTTTAKKMRDVCGERNIDPDNTAIEVIDEWARWLEKYDIDHYNITNENNN